MVENYVHMEGKLAVRSEDTISLLIRRLNEREEYQNASRELIDFGSSAVPSLIHAFTNPEETLRVRLGIARILGEIRDERAIVPLLSVCNLTDEEGEPLDYLIVPALVQFGASALPQLIATLADYKQNVFIRAAAAWTLGMLREPHVLELLVERLRDVKEASRVRSYTATGLGELGDTRAVLPLMETLDSTRDPELRRSIATALGCLGSQRAVDLLIKVLRTDEDQRVQQSAARALGQIGDERAIRPLIAFITQNMVHLAAGEAIAQFGTPALQALLEELEHGYYQPLARQSLVKALGYFRQEEALTRLLAVLTDEDEHPLVRSGAAQSLGIQRDQRASKPLMALLESDEPSSLRASCALALGAIGDQQAATVLQKLLQDGDTILSRENGLRKAVELAIRLLNR